MIGIDEVGRGCLAGPMLVVASRQKSILPTGLRDSKLMSRKQREAIYQSLSASCQFGEGWVSSSEIDDLGLTAATKLGVKRALNAIRALPHEHLIIDGHINYAPDVFSDVEALVGADAAVPLVSAASIYAKVTRDRYMRVIARRYPGYGFDSHVGYGTAFHLAAIKSLGAIHELHRLSFAPLKGLVAEL
jgi:ribonuclease HII